MKYIAKIVVTVGIMFLSSGCTTSSQGGLAGINNGGVCKNPKCQCPKPCQCGAGCKCGMNGNSVKMSNN